MIFNLRKFEPCRKKKKSSANYVHSVLNALGVSDQGSEPCLGAEGFWVTALWKPRMVWHPCSGRKRVEVSLAFSCISLSLFLPTPYVQSLRKPPEQGAEQYARPLRVPFMRAYEMQGRMYCGGTMPERHLGLLKGESGFILCTCTNIS